MAEEDTHGGVSGGDAAPSVLTQLYGDPLVPARGDPTAAAKQAAADAAQARRKARSEQIQSLQASFPAVELARRIAAEWDWSFLPRVLDRYYAVFNPFPGRPELALLTREKLHDLFEHAGIERSRVDDVFTLFSNDVPGHEVVDIHETFAGICLLAGGDFVRPPCTLARTQAGMHARRRVASGVGQLCLCCAVVPSPLYTCRRHLRPRRLARWRPLTSPCLVDAPCTRSPLRRTSDAPSCTRCSTPTARGS